MRHPAHLRRLAAAALVLVTTLATMLATAGAAPAMDPPRPAHEVVDPAFLYRDNCRTRVGPFHASANPDGTPASRVRYGVRNGAAYHIEVPTDWNGEVVVWAHGYNGTGPLLCAGVPNLREHYVRNGYAWAASSYRTNGYDVGTAVRDSRDVLRIFRREVGRPGRVYMTGESMGGHVAAVAVEKYRGVFDAAMPVCGVLGDTELYDYFLDANVTAAALAGAPTPAFPVDPAAYPAYVSADVAPALGLRTSTGGLTPTTAAGRAWGAAVAQRSGGTRPGFAAAFGFWNAQADPATGVPFLFSLYPGTTAGTAGIARGNVTDNTDTVYQLDDDPALTVEEQALNDTVLRVRQSPKGRPSRGLRGVPAVLGDPRVPVLSLHGLGDLFVPFSMEQAYARRVAGHGASGLITQRAVRSTAHCDFTEAELSDGFEDLAAWVRTGKRPAGDDVLDPAVVADPRYGCQFSRGEHPYFTAQTPCP